MPRGVMVRLYRTLNYPGDGGRGDVGKKKHNIRPPFIKIFVMNIINVHKFQESDIVFD